MLTIPPELATQNAELIEAIDALVDRHGRGRSALIPILQDLREQRHQISDVAMQVIADRLGITPVEVQGVVTFYAFLGTRTTGTHVLHVCRTLTCHMAGMLRIAEYLEHELDVSMGETTADGTFTLEWVNCIGMCDQPPAMLVNRDAVGHVTPAIVKNILESLQTPATTP